MLPLKDSQPVSRFAFATYTILGLNVLVFIYQLMLSLDLTGQMEFISRYALVPSTVDFSNFSTLVPFVTSMFLHGGFMHILGNMLFLHIFGDNVEDALGYPLYLLFYITAGIVAALGQYFVNTDSVIPTLGASGAIAGIMGFYLVAFPNNTVKTLVAYYFDIRVVEIPAVLMLGIWGLTQLFNSVGSIGSVDIGGVAWVAHIVGFTFGLAVGWMYIVRGRRSV